MEKLLTWVTKLFQSQGFLELITVTLILFFLFVGASIKHPGTGRDIFIGFLNKNTFASLYYIGLEFFLKYTVRLIGDEAQLNHLRKRQEIKKSKSYFYFVSSFTEQSFDFLLKLAIVYPVAFIICIWIFTGGEASFGGIEIIVDGLNFFQRIALLLLVIFVSYFLAKASNTSSLKSKFFWATMACVGVVALAYAGASVFSYWLVVAFIFGISFAVAFARSGAGSLAIAGAVDASIPVGFSFADALIMENAHNKSGSLTLAFDQAGTAAIVFFLVFVIVVVVDVIKEKYIEPTQDISQKLFWVALYSIYLTVITWLIYNFGQQPNGSSFGLPVIIFLVILPLINTPFDWLSLGITRSLLYGMALQHDGHRTSLMMILWACLDVLVAFFLMIGIVTAATVTISLLNLVYQQGGHHDYILDLNKIFTDLSTDPLHSQYSWLYLMFFSTLLPTLIHFIVALFAVVRSLSPKVLLRSWKLYEGPSGDVSKDNFPLFVGTTLYISVIIPIVLFSSIIGLFILHLIFIQYGYAAIVGESLLNSMQLLAAWIDPKNF